ncbi:hypothetical protein CPC08DRAFT_714228 [Agrocybe pediades]|nr:hypothetical protein CPC08DRAFT_714228 [Agrocybe pediades]
MSEVCAILCTACLDICAGICVDFASLRHTCTETLHSCSCCRPNNQKEIPERRPLLSEQQAPATNQTEPEPQPPMLASPS